MEGGEFSTTPFSMATCSTLELAAHQNTGIPLASTFRVSTSPAPDASTLEDGDILVELKFVSADPYLRSSIRSDRPGAKQPGDAMVCFTSGVVLASKSEKWAPGDFFGGSLPIKSIQRLTKEDMAKTAMWKLNGCISGPEELSLGLGLLGMPGSTAYGGLVDILRPVKGETLLVTSASGAVGQLVGQIAKHLGCTVIGVAGGPAKCAALTGTFGFDHAIDYKGLEGEGVDALVGAIKKVAPKGLHMVFENVGGVQFEACFKCLAVGGRIAVCGGIAGYGLEKPLTVAIDQTAMIYTAQRIEGFVCMPWLTGQRGAFLKDMSEWRKQGVLKHTETYFIGLETWPEAFASLFTGTNNGKVVVKV